MMPFYFLTVAFLLLAALLLLVDSYRRQLSFLLVFRSRLREDSLVLGIFTLSGLLIALGALLFPIAPGPVLAGDFIPAAMCAAVSMFFRFTCSEKRRPGAVSGSSSRPRIFGYACLAAAFLHFLFPSFVLL